MKFKPKLRTIWKKPLAKKLTSGPSTLKLINQRLTDKFATELKKYHMVCFYCGVTMDNRNVNKKCKSNKEKRNPQFKGFTIDSPHSNYDANNYHFFGKPSDAMKQS